MYFQGGLVFVFVFFAPHLYVFPYFSVPFHIFFVFWASTSLPGPLTGLFVFCFFLVILEALPGSPISYFFRIFELLYRDPWNGGVQGPTKNLGVSHRISHRISHGIQQEIL